MSDMQQRVTSMNSNVQLLYGTSAVSKPEVHSSVNAITWDGLTCQLLLVPRPISCVQRPAITKHIHAVIASKDVHHTVLQ